MINLVFGLGRVQPPGIDIAPLATLGHSTRNRYPRHTAIIAVIRAVVPNVPTFFTAVSTVIVTFVSFVITVIVALATAVRLPWFNRT